MVIRRWWCRSRHYHSRSAGASSALPPVFGCRRSIHCATTSRGGPLSYGAVLRDNFERVAVLVDKILRGASPADLPIEQPTRFELVVNLKTARELGLTIPPTILDLADEVIE